MAITSAIVVYAVVWFLVLFCVLPQNLRTQGETGVVFKGTSRSAPSNLNIRKKFIITSIISAVIWALICMAIIYGLISASTMDLFKFFGPRN